MTELENRWTALCARLQVMRRTRIEMWKELEAAYTEPHRFYHTLDHIADGLTTLEYLNADPTTKLAWFWHDFVYDPASKTNEADSAVALWRWEGHVSICDDTGISIVGDAQRLIRLTAHHQPHELDERGKQICVADLLGLASEWDVYTLNADNIRKEYAQFTDEQWVEGRSAFLSSWKGTIFPSLMTSVPKDVRVMWERSARTNMANELKALRLDG